MFERQIDRQQRSNLYVPVCLFFFVLFCFVISNVSFITIETAEEVKFVAEALSKGFMVITVVVRQMSQPFLDPVLP